MKSSRMQILGILAIGAILGYITACSDMKPAEDATAAPIQSNKASQTASQQSPVAEPVQLAQAPATTARGGQDCERLFDQGLRIA